MHKNVTNILHTLHKYYIFDMRFNIINNKTVKILKCFCIFEAQVITLTGVSRGCAWATHDDTCGFDIDAPVAEIEVCSSSRVLP